ncbi:hypothetical protein [Streptomyces rochei]|uniref:hypothetical protein n=1 Tax=Streptomyces rochei TaxID=1928 RepID=UPI0033A64313
MTDAPPTDTELLAELGPLAAVIADKAHTVPVRLGPGGTDDLISELTLAVAVYVGRHVLPAEALALRNPPWPTERDWVVEAQWRDGKWRHYGPAFPDRAAALEQYEYALRNNGTTHAYRLVRATTTYAIDVQHTPEQQS